MKNRIGGIVLAVVLGIIAAAFVLLTIGTVINDILLY